MKSISIAYNGRYITWYCSRTIHFDSFGSSASDTVPKVMFDLGATLLRNCFIPQSGVFMDFDTSRTL